MQNFNTSSIPRNQEFVLRIMDQHYDVLYLHATGMCNQFKKDISYAKDILQDLFLHMLERDELMERGFNRYGIKYILKAMKNQCMNDNRQETARNNREKLVSGTNQGILTNAEDALLLEILDFIQQNMNKITIEVIELYLEGYKNAEISDMIEKTPQAVANIIHRAKCKLKKTFNHIKS